MGLLHTACCIALCIAPPVIYFQASPLFEHDALRSAGHGLVSAVICSLIKLFITALFVPTGSGWFVIGLKGVSYMLLGMADILCLWAAFTKFQHRVSTADRFQAIGLGWALGDAVLSRVGPILMGAHASEYTLEYVLEAGHSNVMLAFMMSMSAVGALLWSKRSKSASLLTRLRLALLAHTALVVAVSWLQDGRVLLPLQLLGVEAAGTALLAAWSYSLWHSATAR